MPTVLICRLPHGLGLPVPEPQTSGSAGADIVAAEGAVLQPMERRLFPTGFAVAVPVGYEIQIRPRSGLAINHGVTLPNTPATIDSDYRGELKVGLVNLGTQPFEVTRGMRIAQLVVARVEAVQFEPVEALPPTTRGEGGFGSTGV